MPRIFTQTKNADRQFAYDDTNTKTIQYKEPTSNLENFYSTLLHPEIPFPKANIQLSDQFKSYVGINDDASRHSAPTFQIPPNAQRQLQRPKY